MGRWGEIWRIFWPRANTVWNTFETLSCSTWYLPPRRLHQWIRSNQKGVLLPKARHEYRLNLLTLWLVLHTIRYVVYIALNDRYPTRRAGGRVLRFPYYFANVLQLLIDFEIYYYIAAVITTTLCFVTTFQLRLSRYVDERIKQLCWYRVMVYTEAMLVLPPKRAKSYFLVLRRIPPAIYERYCKKFSKIVSVQTLGLRLNSLYVPLAFVTFMSEVIRHPEYEYPVFQSIFIVMSYILFYYFLFTTGFCLLLIFLFNASFVLMMLETVDYRLQPHWPVGYVLTQFNATNILLDDINRFWQNKLGNYYIFLIPTVMLLLYLLLFIPMIPLILVLFAGIVVMFGTSMHWINWMAGEIQILARVLFRNIYHRGIIFSQRHSIVAKFKLMNMSATMHSGKKRFGLKLGTMGTLHRRASVIILFTMAQGLMLAIKMAQNFSDLTNRR